VSVTTARNVLNWLYEEKNRRDKRRNQMKKKFTEIICIVDRSGSMAIIRDDAIGGFNAFLEEQKKEPGKATMTFIQFDTEYEVIYENKPLKEIPPLDGKTFRPRGMTALLDAIGRTVETVKKRLSNVPKKNRPSKVIVSILTDGEENSSREFKLKKIKEMIKHQKEKHSWEFIFLGANQDAFAEAVKIGIDKKDAFNFVATGAGIQSAYKNLCVIMTLYRTK
jgi:uncharacterized protein YegL